MRSSSADTSNMNSCFHSAMWLPCLQSWHQKVPDVSACDLADQEFAERFIPMGCNGSESSFWVTRPMHDHRTVETSPNSPKPSQMEETITLIASVISADSRPLS